MSKPIYGHFEEVLTAQDNGDKWYTIHSAHMTSEALHAKSHIAAELAYRDRKIQKLKEKNAELRAKLHKRLSYVEAYNK